MCPTPGAGVVAFPCGSIMGLLPSGLACAEMGASGTSGLVMLDVQPCVGTSRVEDYPVSLVTFEHPVRPSRREKSTLIP